MTTKERSQGLLGSAFLFHIPTDLILAMDRRHWMLLIVALACIAALGAWIVELDWGLSESMDPAPTTSQPR